MSSEAVFQTASAAKVSCCLFTGNNESISTARLQGPLQLYSITASQAEDVELRSLRGGLCFDVKPMLSAHTRLQRAVLGGLLR